MVVANRRSGKRYFVIDVSGEAIPVEQYPITEDDGLSALIRTECFGDDPRSASESERLERMMVGLGFEWEVLAEQGHLRRKPYAVTMTEAIERHAWDIVAEFCARVDIPLHRVSGGELLDPSNPAIAAQLGIITTNPMYGTSHYHVTIDERRLMLRYSACLAKLSLAREAGLRATDLPIGIFEVSKSYRHEHTHELQLCEQCAPSCSPTARGEPDFDATLRAWVPPPDRAERHRDHASLTSSAAHRTTLRRTPGSADRPRGPRPSHPAAVHDAGSTCGNGVAPTSSTRSPTARGCRSRSPHSRSTTAPPRSLSGCVAFSRLGRSSPSQPCTRCSSDRSNVPPSV